MEEILKLAQIIVVIMMRHTKKLYMRINEQKLRHEIHISENLVCDRSIMEAVYIIRRLIERFRERKRDLNIVFIDLEKLIAYL